MNPIEFISAGAGSGKTYRLTSILAEALISASARPAGIVATTFTVKAAAELRQRARKALLDAGRLDLATAIGQARIGTVNSVCGELLKRYCFELGQSPDQTVLSEVECATLLRTAVDDVLDGTQRQALVHFGHRFGFENDDWTEPVHDIVDAARANGISADALRAMGPANAKAMLASWPAPEQGPDHTSELAAALPDVLAELELHVETAQAAGKEVIKTTTTCLEKLRQHVKKFGEGSWNWGTWASCADLNAGAKLRAMMQPAVDAAVAHDRHPEFHRNVHEYLTLVFNLAASALSNYEIAKRESGSVDFTDQETLVLKALQESASVRESVASELDLVLVDEFQDTSPIQLAVFVELAKLAKRSIWVGDPKQAIYGFRGTDAQLISSVLDAIPQWGGRLGEPLTTSRRSVPSLVKLVNAAFVPAFAPKMAAANVELTPSRPEIPGQTPLMTWRFDSDVVANDFLGLGPAITSLLASGIQVEDRHTRQLRTVQPGDIAVLCRYKKDVMSVSATLHKWDIPAVSTRPGLLSTPEATLVVACLRRLYDREDSAATAAIVSLTGGRDASTWVTDRLQFLAGGQPQGTWKTAGTDVHPLIQRLEALRPQLSALTPTEALRLAKAESHVCAHAAQWSSSQKEAAIRVANVEALQDMAKAYEDECRSGKRPATCAGLLQWLSDRASQGQDPRASAQGGAVEVLTHHSAKGLEWPIAILTGLGSLSRTALWDVRARTQGTFDAQAPLAGRFIHYWPKPYGKSKPQAFKNAEASDIGTMMAAQSLAENKRLLYVSVTRARDVLVMTASQKNSSCAWCDEAGATALFFGGEGDVKLPNGEVVARTMRNYSAADIRAEPPLKSASDRNWFVRSPANPRLPLWLRPSSANAGQHTTAEVVPLGSRIKLVGAVDMASLGSALHHCIALHFADPGAGATLAAVQEVLRRWGVDTVIDAQSALDQVAALHVWVKGKWPDARGIYAEVPLEVMLDSGQVVRGQIDLLIQTDAGLHVLDHKADPRRASNDDRLATSHGPQLASYAAALTSATGLPVLGTWLFLPVAGEAVRIEAQPEPAI
jgi:ATP-dependent exoDNAse (exonuclease V) beta subunit